MRNLASWAYFPHGVLIASCRSDLLPHDRPANPAFRRTKESSGGIQAHNQIRSARLVWDLVARTVQADGRHSGSTHDGIEPTTFRCSQALHKRTGIPDGRPRAGKRSAGDLRSFGLSAKHTEGFRGVRADSTTDRADISYGHESSRNLYGRANASRGPGPRWYGWAVGHWDGYSWLWTRRVMTKEHGSTTMVFRTARK